MNRRKFVSAMALTGIAAGCASTPVPRLYVLSPSVPKTAPTSRLAVVVGPVTIPGAVNRPQIVISAGANELQVDEFNRWASPIQDNLALVISLDLAALLDTSDVSVAQASGGLEADYRVGVDVQRFDSFLGKAAVLDVIWVVHDARRSTVKRGRSTLREAVANEGYDALVAAHSRAVNHLSEDIAAAIHSLESATH